MVNGVLTIPLSGTTLGSPHAPWGTSLRAGEFFAGSENALAAAALAPLLDQNTADVSPLVFYGPHGSGKTHLALGLADWWRHHFRSANVGVCTAAEFAQQHAQALTNDRLDAWRDDTRSHDLLVIEDLGEFKGKLTAQRELCQLLDTLSERESLVVVTSRSLPSHLNLLLPALRSRLSAGLVVGLALPARATRRAILARFADSRGVPLAKRALDALADGITAGVPALMAAVLDLELAARATACPGTGAPLGTVESAQIRELVAARGNVREPSLREIASLTARYFGLKLSELKSPLRRQTLVSARGVAMYLARQLTPSSLEKIGDFFGGRDHTTVLHGCRRIEKLVRRDRAIKQAVAELKRLLLPV